MRPAPAGAHPPLHLDRLRREIEPLSGADFMRFLFACQHVSADSRLSDEAALAAVLEQLSCFEAPAQACEALPGRLSDVDPAWLDRFCLSGQKAWRRRRPNAPGEGAAATLQNRVELPILYPMNSKDPDPYTRAPSA